jgi:hypothetical protein
MTNVLCSINYNIDGAQWISCLRVPTCGPVLKRIPVMPDELWACGYAHGVSPIARDQQPLPSQFRSKADLLGLVIGTQEVSSYALPPQPQRGLEEDVPAENTTSFY